MKNKEKTKEELTRELATLQKQVENLIISESKHQEAEEELARRTEQLIALYELGKKITSMTSKDDLIPWIAEQAARLLDAGVCKFWIKEGPYLVKGGGTKEGLELMQKERLRMGESLSGIIAQEKKPLIVDDVKKDERYIKSHRKAAAKHGYVSFFGVPMITGEKTIGVINIYTKELRKFTQKDVELLSAFADMAAVALENARLIGDLHQEIAERRNAEQKIQASLEEKDVLLKEIHNRVRNNLEVTSSLLALQASLIKDKDGLEIWGTCIPDIQVKGWLGYFNRSDKTIEIGLNKNEMEIVNYYGDSTMEKVMPGIYKIKSIWDNKEYRINNNSIGFKIKPGDVLFIYYEEIME
jgi:putative methionine-R-sulfoxide reductase with GAF domain